MADKGLLESARRMYGAKDAARQEAKKDMLRSGEILYRGLRDFGVAKQREDALRRSEAARQQAMEVSERRFQESMSFREQQMDWQKLKYEEAQQQREYDLIAQNSAVLQATLGKIQEDPGVLVGNSLKFYKDEISKLSDMIARREGDPKQLTEQRQKLLNELSTASGQYNTFLDGARQILGMNLSDPNALPDFDIMSNDPKSLKAKKMWTTVINGMRDGTAKFNFDGGDFTVTANFDGQNPSTIKLNESGMLDYNLKNSGKGNELFGIYGNSVNAAAAGNKANAQLLATNYAASLSYNDAVSLSRDYDPNWNGTDTSTFKYNRFDGQDGKRVEMINNTWMDAQNMWWDEIRNKIGVSGNEQEWKDNEGNTYKRSGEGADMRWTKTDANGNMSEHEWWNDKGWSGDNGTGIKLRDAFSNWLGDISADYINKTHYKEKPSQGSRWKPNADLSNVFLGIDKAVNESNYDRLIGLELLPDLKINNIETVTKEDGTQVLELFAGQKVGNDVVQRKIVELNPLTPGANKEKLFNFVGDTGSGNVYTAARYGKYNFNVDDKPVETDETTETTETTEIENLTLEDAKAMLKLHQDTMSSEENLGASGYPTVENINKETELQSMVDDLQDKENTKQVTSARQKEKNKNALVSANKIIADFEKIKANDFFTPQTMNIVKRLAESSGVIIDPKVGITKEQRDKVAEVQGFNKNNMYRDAMKMFYNQFDNLLQSKNISEETRKKIEELKNSLEN